MEKAAKRIARDVHACTRPLQRAEREGEEKRGRERKREIEHIVVSVH